MSDIISVDPVSAGRAFAEPVSVGRAVSLRVLKNRARKLQRAEGITHCAALDRIARSQGFASWSLLALRAVSRGAEPTTAADELFQRLRPGQSLLLGSRPQHGKTARAVALLIAALRRGLPCWFFSLANDATDVAPLFAACAEPYPAPTRPFTFQHSDELHAATILDQLRGRVVPGSVVVIDHLQLLDQRRSSPELQQQLEQLARFAQQSGCIFVFLSQIRPFPDGQGRPPTADDIRLPNALDLRVFDQLVFLHRGSERRHEHP